MIYKNYGIFLPLEQQNDLLEYLSLDSPNNTINLQMMTRIFQVVAKIQFNKLKNQENLITPPTSQIQNFAQNLSSKLKLAFRDEYDLMAWMDLSGSHKIRPDEFWFGVSYFCAGVSVVLTSILFDFLDNTEDGQLDIQELGVLMKSAEIQDGHGF